MNASASAKRRAGSFQRAHDDGLERGRDRRVEADGGTGASLTCLSAIVTALSPSNGTRPVSISYRMIPTE